MCGGVQHTRLCLSKDAVRNSSHACLCGRFHSVGQQNHIIWKARPCHAYMDIMHKVKMKQFCATQTSVREPAQGTEVAYQGSTSSCSTLKFALLLTVIPYRAALLQTTVAYYRSGNQSNSSKANLQERRSVPSFKRSKKPTSVKSKSRSANGPSPIFEGGQLCRYARVDRRPLNPPPCVWLQLYEITNPGTNRATEVEIQNCGHFTTILPKDPTYSVFPSDIQNLRILCHVDLFPVPDELRAAVLALSTPSLLYSPPTVSTL
jgi:hypothetical protein